MQYGSSNRRRGAGKAKKKSVLGKRSQNSAALTPAPIPTRPTGNPFTKSKQQYSPNQKNKEKDNSNSNDNSNNNDNNENKNNSSERPKAFGKYGSKISGYAKAMAAKSKAVAEMVYGDYAFMQSSPESQGKNKQGSFVGSGGKDNDNELIRGIQHQNDDEEDIDMDVKFDESYLQSFSGLRGSFIRQGSNDNVNVNDALDADVISGGNARSRGRGRDRVEFNAVPVLSQRSKSRLKAKSKDRRARSKSKSKRQSSNKPTAARANAAILSHLDSKQEPIDIQDVLPQNFQPSPQPEELLPLSETEIEDDGIDIEDDSQDGGIRFPRNTFKVATCSSYNPRLKNSFDWDTAVPDGFTRDLVQIAKLRRYLRRVRGWSGSCCASKWITDFFWIYFNTSFLFPKFVCINCWRYLWKNDLMKYVTS